MNPYLKAYNLYRQKEPVFTRAIEANTVEYYCRSRGYWTSDWSDSLDIRCNRIEGFVIAECLRCNKHKRVHTTLADCATSFYADAAVIESFTNGHIDFRKVGSYRGACLKYFFDCANGVKHTDIVQPDAFEIAAIEDAVRGGISYYVPGTYTDLHQYDINSFYPFLLSREYNTFPIKAGIQKKIEGELKRTMPYGLYMCCVRFHKSAEPKMQRVLKVAVHDVGEFMCSADAWYTHIEIRMLRDYGYEVTLCTGEACNAITYPDTTRVAGSKLFGKYVYSLYALKRDERNAAVRPIIKALLNRLWGSLVYTQSRKRLYFSKDEPFEFRSAGRKNIQMLTDEMTGETIGIEYEESGRSAVLPWLKPFLLAYGRSYLMKRIADKFDVCVFAATDSIVCTRCVPALQEGDTSLLGYFSKSFYNNIDIVTSNQIKRSQACNEVRLQSDESDTE